MTSTPAEDAASPLGYRAALAALVATGSRGIKAGLERTTALLDELGRPQDGLRGVLIAGTNGKGSVAALVDAACRAAALHSVLLTKPHLQSYRERIAIDGEPIGEAGFAALLQRIIPAASAMEDAHGAPTQFEILTAMGIFAAAEQRPDVVICEVGLGGRLDSTNVLDLGVAVITNVALDHREMLGDTIVEIATEKAAIVKHDDHAVTGTSGDALPVVRRRAAAVGARQLTVVGEDVTMHAESRGREGVDVHLAAAQSALDVHVPLAGMHQAHNAAVAYATCLALRGRGITVGDDAIRRGFASVRWPGRLQWIAGTPDVILDGAHNPDALAAIVPAVREMAGERRVVVLFGVMGDKDVDAMLAQLRPLGAIPVMTQAATPRAMPAVELARRWGAGARAVADLPDALRAARLLAGQAGIVLACGSIYLLGDLLPLL